MKKLKIFFLLILILFFSMPVSAQLMREIKVGTYTSRGAVTDGRIGQFNRVRADMFVDSDTPNFHCDPNGMSRLHMLDVHERFKCDLIYVIGGDYRIQYDSPAVPDGLLLSLRDIAVENWIRFDVDESELPYGEWEDERDADGVPTGSQYWNSIGGKHVHTYDIAEGVRIKNAEPGDVVRISPDEDLLLEKTVQAFDPTVAGIVSSNPKIYMGSGEGKTPLALAGIVDCRVTAENGPVEKGDLLVSSSLAGYAMRADPDRVKPGMSVGQAMEPLAAGTGLIKVLVNR